MHHAAAGAYSYDSGNRPTEVAADRCRLITYGTAHLVVPFDVHMACIAVPQALGSSF